MLDLDYDGSAQVNPDNNLFSAPVIEDTRYRPPSIAGKNGPAGTATCRFGQSAALNSLTGLAYIDQLPAAHSYDYHARVQPQMPVYHPAAPYGAGKAPYNTPVTLVPSYVQMPTPGTSNPGSMSTIQNWAPVGVPQTKEHFTAGTAPTPPAKGGLNINMTLMDTILFIMFIVVMVMLSFMFGVHVGKKGRKEWKNAAEKSGKYLVVHTVPGGSEGHSRFVYEHSLASPSDPVIDG